jgi:hypothetical protein
MSTLTATERKAGNNVGSCSLKTDPGVAALPLGQLVRLHLWRLPVEHIPAKQKVRTQG